MSRSRSFTFTLNNYTESEIKEIKELNYVYLIFGYETGENDTPHLQGYIYFKSQVTFNSIKNKIPRAHIEIAKGNSLHNYEYCTKQGNFEEYGERPKTQQEKGTSEKERWQKARKAAELGKFEEIDDDIFLRHYGNIKRIHADNRPKVESLPNTTGLWIHGPTGSGKTTYVLENYKSLYVKNSNKWFTGYKDEEAVLLDDLDPDSAKHLVRYIKLWADHHPFAAETKGGEILIRPKHFIITSNYSLEECFFGVNQVDIDALLRRFEIKEIK